MKKYIPTILVLVGLAVAGAVANMVASWDSGVDGVGNLIYKRSDVNHAKLYVQGGEAKDAYMVLEADDSDDAADTWYLHVKAGGGLDIANESTGVAIAISSAGVVTFPDGVTIGSGTVGAGTFSALTLITGGVTTRWDNASSKIDGEQIADDTIDDDALDFSDITGADLTLTDCGAIVCTSIGTGTGEATVDGKYAVVGGDATTGLMVLKGAVTSGTNATETVTFGTVFGAAPIVTCTYTEDPGDVRPIFVTSVTASNFVANITADKNFGYVAVGTRP